MNLCRYKGNISQTDVSTKKPPTTNFRQIHQSKEGHAKHFFHWMGYYLLEEKYYSLKKKNSNACKKSFQLLIITLLAEYLVKVTILSITNDLQEIGVT